MHFYKNALVFHYIYSNFGSMTTNTSNKLKQLFKEHVPGTVLLASWLEKKGFSYDLQQYYRRSGWLENMGTGAFKMSKEKVTWQGGLFALQSQAKLPVHVGGLKALSLQGYSHYFRLGEETVYLFTPAQIKLPVWFRKYHWEDKIEHIQTSILTTELGLVAFEDKNLTIQISTPERAILECLYLSPNNLDLVESYQVFEGLTNIRPKLMQKLLEACSSVKVKRLFLYMADKAQHQWLSFIDQSGITLGRGDRSLIKGGVYISQFHISVPKELAAL
jgi:hypothetical protein